MPPNWGVSRTPPGRETMAVTCAACCRSTTPGMAHRSRNRDRVQHPPEVLMFATSFRVVLVLGLGGLGHGIVTAADPLPRLPRDNLLLYRGPDGAPVPV